MRINHDDMKLKDEEERLKAYGYTDCINDLLIWLKELEKLDIKVIIIK